VQTRAKGGGADPGGWVNVARGRRVNKNLRQSAALRRRVDPEGTHCNAKDPVTNGATRLAWGGLRTMEVDRPRSATPPSRPLCPWTDSTTSVAPRHGPVFFGARPSSPSQENCWGPTPPPKVQLGYGRLGPWRPLQLSGAGDTRSASSAASGATRSFTSASRTKTFQYRAFWDVAGYLITEDRDQAQAPLRVRDPDLLSTFQQGDHAWECGDRQL